MAITSASVSVRSPWRTRSGHGQYGPQVYGDRYRRAATASYGGALHNCLTSCIVKSSNVVHDSAGKYKTSALELETLAVLGSNCGLDSREDVADLDRLCDDLGLDTIETGAAIAIYLDADQMKFGDAEGLKNLLQEIADGTDIGKAVANDAVGVNHTAGLILNPGLPEDQWAAESQLSPMINVICDSSGFRQVLQPSVNEIRLFCAAMLWRRSHARADR